LGATKARKYWAKLRLELARRTEIISETTDYKFIVVKSDMTESDYSNVAQGTPLDTIPPAISHTPVTTAAPGLALTIYADVTDNVVVQDVILHYRAIGATTYTGKAMVKTTGNRYSATIEGARMTSPGLEYYIEAGDGISTVRAGRPEYPYQVSVVDRPVVTAISPNRGPASGGTAVTIAGSNFKPGATATIGGAACGSLTVVSASQITCTTPAHYPETVDVTVTNPDSQSGTLLRGFTYESETATLSLPDTGGQQHAIVQVPVSASNVQGLAATRPCSARGAPARAACPPVGAWRPTPAHRARFAFPWPVPAARSPGRACWPSSSSRWSARPVRTAHWGSRTSP
jgi:hypothetical protein